jgi:hypothetical protein
MVLCSLPRLTTGAFLEAEKMTSVIFLFCHGFNAQLQLHAGFDDVAYAVHLAPLYVSENAITDLIAFACLILQYCFAWSSLCQSRHIEKHC